MAGSGFHEQGWLLAVARTADRGFGEVKGTIDGGGVPASADGNAVTWKAQTVTLAFVPHANEFRFRTCLGFFEVKAWDYLDSGLKKASHTRLNLEGPSMPEAVFQLVKLEHKPHKVV